MSPRCGLSGDLRRAPSALRRPVRARAHATGSHSTRLPRSAVPPADTTCLFRLPRELETSNQAKALSTFLPAPPVPAGSLN